MAEVCDAHRFEVSELRHTAPSASGAFMAELFRLPPKRVWPNGRCVVCSGRPFDHWNSYPAVEGAGCDERPRSVQQREYVGIASLYSPPIPKSVCPGFQSGGDVGPIVSDPNVIDVKALTEARITLKTKIVEKVPANPPLIGPDRVVEHGEESWLCLSGKFVSIPDYKIQEGENLRGSK
jgi:hypothetical protein